MATISPQIIKTAGGEELVVLTRAEFEALRAGAGDDAQDAKDAELLAERYEALGTGRDMRLPAEISAALLRGESLFRAIRKWKDVTQAELARRTGLAQGYLSDIETRRKRGGRETLRLVAEALVIDPTWLS